MTSDEVEGFKNLLLHVAKDRVSTWSPSDLKCLIDSATGLQLIEREVRKRETEIRSQILRSAKAGKV